MSENPCIHQRQLPLLTARSNAAVRRGSVAATTAIAEHGAQTREQCRVECHGRPRSPVPEHEHASEDDAVPPLAERAVLAPFVRAGDVLITPHGEWPVMAAAGRVPTRKLTVASGTATMPLAVSCLRLVTIRRTA